MSGNNDQRFEAFYSEYYDRVFKYIVKKTGNFHAAEDLTMDTFTACYRHFENYDESKASLGTWVFTIASNKLKNYYRSEQGFAELQENAAIDDGMEDAVVEAQHLAEMRDVLADALETLNEVQQQVIVLKYFKSKNSKEIAQITGLSPDNVRAIASRTVKKLKEYFDMRQIAY